MRRHPLLIILIVLGVLVALVDVAFIIYVGVTLTLISKGEIFLPQIFNTVCLATAIINGVVIFYAVLYITLLRK